MFIDATIYDLKTPKDQDRALQDIIEEHNRQYDQSEATISYDVVGYTQLTVDLINGGASGVYTATYVHGLGYPPAVLAFGLVAGAGYAPIQYVEKKGGVFTADPEANTYQYFTVDSQNLYFNVLGVNIAGSFTTTHFTAAFYIFNLPLNIGTT